MIRTIIVSYVLSLYLSWVYTIFGSNELKMLWFYTNCILVEIKPIRQDLNCELNDGNINCFKRIVLIIVEIASCRVLDLFWANYQITILPVTPLQTIVTYSSSFSYDIWHSIRRLRAFTTRCKFCPQTYYGCSVRSGIMLITTIGIGPRFFFQYAGNVPYTNMLFVLPTVRGNHM